MTDIKLLGISGSLRKGSHNTKLLHEATQRFGPAEVTIGSLDLPLYNGDLEDKVGLPPVVATLVQQIRDSDAIILATPEYNKMIPGVVKNALDWISRAKPQPLIDKPLAIVSTGGRSGGEVAQFTLRHALATFNARLLQGSAMAVPGGDKAFDADRRLISEAHQKSLDRLMARLREAAQ